MAASVILALLLVSLPTGRGFTQCFTNTNCTGDEVVALDKRDCCVGTDDGLSFSDGSNCSLCIVHGFLQAEYDVQEDEGLDTVFQRNVKGTTPFGSDLVVVGTITAEADGTANTTDFEMFVSIEVINSAEIRLFTTNDEVTLEYYDRVLLKFTPNDPALIPGLKGYGEYIRDTATVNVIDSDLLEINFGKFNYRVEEDSEGLNYPIILQFRENQNPFNITLTPVTVNTAEAMGLGFFINSGTIVQGSRTTAVDDFSNEPVTVVVPAGSRTFTVPEFFTIVDDNMEENEESFAVVAEIGLDVPENSSCLKCLVRQGATEIKIIDNDPPSGSPVMLTAVARKGEVLLSWSPPPITQRNGVLTNYTISCSPSPSSLPQSLTHHQNTSTTVTGLSPKTLYNCSVVAWNSQGSGPPANTTFTTLEDYVFFQLRLGGLLSSCPDLVTTERSAKLQDITREVVEKLAASCSDCSITNDIIDKQSFSCYPDSPSFLTYRARLEGISERDSSSLVSLIEAWVRGGQATVIVTGVLMRVDTECPVAISSLSEKECLQILPSQSSAIPTTTVASTLPNGSSSATVIIAVVVVVAVLIIGILVLVIALQIRNWLAKHPPMHASEREPHLKEGDIMNEAYGEVKRGRGEGYEMVNIPPTAPVTKERKDDGTSVTTQPLPPTPSTADEQKKEDEDGVYESIPGDIQTEKCIPGES